MYVNATFDTFSGCCFQHLTFNKVHTHLLKKKLDQRNHISMGNQQGTNIRVVLGVYVVIATMSGLSLVITYGSVLFRV